MRGRHNTELRIVIYTDPQRMEEGVEQLPVQGWHLLSREQRPDGSYRLASVRDSHPSIPAGREP